MTIEGSPKKRRAIEMERLAADLRPALLDVVLIDGRLAQVGPSMNGVIFLAEKAETGENKFHPIDWSKYDCEVPVNHSINVGLARKSRLITMSDREYQALHWGPGQDQYPNLKEEITFFGRFTKRSLP